MARRRDPPRPEIVHGKASLGGALDKIGGASLFCIAQKGWEGDGGVLEATSLVRQLNRQPPGHTMTNPTLIASIVPDPLGSHDQSWIEVRDADASRFADPNPTELLAATEQALYALRLPADARVCALDERLVLVDPLEENDENLLGQSLEYIRDAINHGIDFARECAIGAAELAESNGALLDQ